MRRRFEPVQPAAEEKVLDVTASMQGTLRFDDPVNLRISGKFEGSLETKGMLFVGERSDIRANISGENISVAGTVNGNIKATKLLKLESTAKVNGDIEAVRIFIAEGAAMNGHLRMDTGAPARDEWMTVDQVAKYLEVEENKVSEWATGGMLPGTKDGGMWLFERSRVDLWIANGKVRG